jgi:hypothetical protein
MIGITKIHWSIRFPVLILGLVVSLIQGCSTSGKVAGVEIQPAPPVLIVERPIPYDLSAHEKVFVDIFEKRGIYRGESNDPNALKLKLEFNPNIFSMSVTATLSQNGKVIAVGRSHNPGFGTLIARDAAIAALVSGAAAELDSRIDWRLKIVGAKPSNGEKSDLYDELAKLEDLHQRGILSDAEFTLAKKRLLSR